MNKKNKKKSKKKMKMMVGLSFLKEKLRNLKKKNPKIMEKGGSILLILINFYKETDKMI